MFQNIFKPKPESQDSLNVVGQGNAELHEQLMSSGTEAAHSKANAAIARSWGCSDATLEAIRDSARNNS